ncbi:MAG: nickel-responsive transcriptional regulator NikR [Gemmataceae bacterium]
MKRRNDASKTVGGPKRTGERNVSEIVRFSVSLESDLLERFDRFCTEGQFATRSEAIRQLLRERLTSAALASDAVDVAASLTLVYDHHRAKLTDRMIEIQHAHADWVVASMHVHLTHDLCMELIALRGPASEIQKLAAELSGLKGIHQAQVVFARAEDGSDHHHHGDDHSHHDHNHDHTA